MLYETAARASEVLALDVGDLDRARRRARVRSKGAARTWLCGRRPPPASWVVTWPGVMPGLCFDQVADPHRPTGP